MCTLACPFGAIQIQAEFMPSVDYVFEPLLNLGLESEIGAKSIAVKCDLCKGREEGPACVEVCPTGALMFIRRQEEVVSKKAALAVESFVQSAKSV